MVDFLANLWNAWQQRIRAPFIGSIALSFIAINWKPIWYLLFANATARDKFHFFDNNTSLFSLIFIPVILGIFLALISPWLRLVGTWWTQVPASTMKKIQADSEHDLKVHHEVLAKKLTIPETERTEEETGTN